MKLRRGQWFLLLFNFIYIVGFALYYISINDYEFLWYAAVLVFFFLLIGLTLHKSKFDYPILLGLSLWGLMHMAGGGLVVGDGVLYKLQLIHLFDVGDTYVLKFDQFVHAFGFGVTTLVAYHLLKPYLNQKVNYKIMYPTLVTISMGLGALNEVVKFIAVVSFPETGVGGYFNTALDLVFNTLGAVIGALVVHVRRKQIEK